MSQSTFHFDGSNLLAEITRIIKDWNARKIVIKERRGEITAKFPLIFGIIGIIISPTLAVIGVITVFVTHCSVAVEKEQ